MITVTPPQLLLLSTVAGKNKQTNKQTPHWILKPKMWDSSKQDTFRDGREGVSVFWGNTIYSLLHDWITIHLKKKKAFSNQFK